MATNTPVVISADHAGFARKEWLKQLLMGRGYQVTDLGPETLQPDDDYPAYAFRLAEAVVGDPLTKGILLCGNGQGICVAANKVTGIRAVSAFSPEMAVSTRNDDNANVLCLPGRFQENDEIGEIAIAWLETQFSDEERHHRRIGQLAERESAHS